jgi:putrescine transport system ATP-binding protein
LNDILRETREVPDQTREPAGADDRYIELEAVTKKFGMITAVDGVTLDIKRGEFFALLGPSGCGKTTLLRMLAGLETPTSGRIRIDGQDITDVPPYDRPVNMMFQSYALFPHMTVERNVAFGLRQERMSKRDIETRVGELLELVQLSDYAKRKPAELSGGQSQRVALARSLAKRPKLLLLDEPLAALDKKLREETQFELMNIQERTNVTFVVVTHDQEEAMTLSSRIAVMNQGEVQQMGTPTEIYEFPRTRYVADFLGSINLFEGTIAEGSAAGDLFVESPEAGVTLRLDSSETYAPGTDVHVAVRPEKIELSRERPDQEENRCQGKVVEVAYQGSLSVYRIELPTGKIARVTMPNHARTTERKVDWGDEVWLCWERHAAVVLAD